MQLGPVTSGAGDRMHDNEREHQREGLETPPHFLELCKPQNRLEKVPHTPPPPVEEVEADSISNFSTALGLSPSGVGAGGPQAAVLQTTVGDLGLREPEHPALLSPWRQG